MAFPVVGDVFAGKYAIEAVVGRGGMGVVLSARHLELDEPVAIKLILAEDNSASPETLGRFVREAKLASKIKSEHVVRVLDVARLETGEPYIVMELLEGQDLAQVLDQKGPLSIEQAALYMLQVCEAIAEAHLLGIVHRDLKPANLFLTTLRDGAPCVKVLDFGISKLVGEQRNNVTKTDTLMGSPLYMSPDQLMMGRDLDARSDVWSLGVILFELLTGRAPFDGEDTPQLIAQILHKPAPSLLAFRPDAPPELAALIESALVKDRDQRLPNVAALGRGLAAIAPDLGRSSMLRIDGLMSRSGSLPASPPHERVGTGSGAVAGGTPSATAGGAALDLTSTRKHLTVVQVLAVLGLLAAGVVGGSVLLHRAPALPAASTSPLAATPPSVATPPVGFDPSPTSEPVNSAAANLAAANLAAAPPEPPAPPSASAAAPHPSGAPRTAATVGLRPKLPAKPHAGVPADPFGGVR